MQRKAAAGSAAAHAASRKRTAAVEVSAENEERARQALAGLELPADRPASHLVESDAGELATALIDLFEKLASEGFKDEQIEESFRAVPLDALSEQSALDWLCLNLDAAALPRRYSGGPGQRANASSIKVLAGALAHRQQVQEVAAAQQDAAALRKAEAERQRRQAEEAAATRSRQEAR
eukprot:jgi/Astpho2/9684/Aster-x0864